MFLAVPKDGKWNLDGTDGDYINQLFVQANARRYYVTMQDNFYVFGVGAGSTAVHQAAIRLSSHWSGLATFGDLHEEVLQRSTALQRTGNNGATELFVSAAQVQLPVWMSWTENAGVNADVCAYWKAANDADEECFSNRWADEIYFPGKVVKTSQVNEEKSPRFVSQTVFPESRSWQGSVRCGSICIWPAGIAASEPSTCGIGSFPKNTALPITP